MKNSFIIDRQALATQTHKICNTCGKDKLLDEFHHKSDAIDGRRNDCKECRKKFKDKTTPKILPDKIICGCCGKSLPRTSEYFPGKLEVPTANRKCYACRNQYSREANYQVKYFITVEEYNKLLEEQGGVCYICGSDYKLVVDHDHTSNKVRKILCDACNRALGFFRENTEVMQKAINYINEHKK